MQTYLEQMKRAARRAGLPLIDAVKAAGISDSLYYRWNLDQCSPTRKSAQRVMEAIKAHRCKTTAA